MNKLNDQDKQEITYNVLLLIVMIIVGAAVLMFSVYMLDSYFVGVDKPIESFE